MFLIQQDSWMWNICQFNPCQKHVSLSLKCIKVFRVQCFSHSFDYICTCISAMYYNHVIMIMCMVSNDLYQDWAEQITLQFNVGFRQGCFLSTKLLIYIHTTPFARGWSRWRLVVKCNFGVQGSHGIWNHTWCKIRTVFLNTFRLGCYVIEGT
jgi:hypothetical protein